MGLLGSLGVKPSDIASTLPRAELPWGSGGLSGSRSIIFQWDH